MTELIYFLERIYRMTGIPIRCLDSATILFSRGYENHQDPFMQDPHIQKTLDAKLGDGPILEFEDEIFLYGAIHDHTGHNIYAGPVLLGEADNFRINAYARRHNINGDIKIKPSNLTRFTSMLEAIYFARSGTLIPETDLATIPSITKTPVNTSLQAYMMDSTEREARRFSYTDEKLFMQRIREGDWESIKAYMLGATISNLSSVDELVGKVALNKFKHFEYIVCSTITLASRAAMEGGMDAASAYALSDLYFQRLEKAKSIIEMLALLKEVQLDYALRVRKVLDKRNKTSYVEKCKSYVTKHLNKPFTMEDIAKAVGISIPHLTRLFSRQEGIGVMEYVRAKRIDTAADMLRYTNDSLSEIAAHLCFPSQSYFGVVFKKYMGLTPKQYRDRQKLIDVNI